MVGFVLKTYEIAKLSGELYNSIVRLQNKVNYLGKKIRDTFFS